jgi:tetratricopeptide (TPR) repeat protein
MPAWRRELLLALALAGLTLLAFEGVRHNQFVGFDDPGYITDNPHVQAGLTAESVGWAFTTFTESNWHPLTWISLQLDAALYGLDPIGFHRTNLLLHLANVLLLFGVLGRMTQAPWQSATVAALFAVHPLHVESVAWAAERKDVLSTLLWMLTLWAYVAYVTRPTWQRYAWVVVSLACGLLAKPMLVTLPCVLLLLDYWPLGRWPHGTVPLRWLIVEKLPLFALVLASSIMTFLAQEQGGAIAPLELIPFASRVANALLAALGYLGKMVWPVHLAAFYPILGPDTWGWPALAAGGVLAALTCAALLRRRQQPYLLVGWLWYLGTLVPVSGLIQVGGQAMADRYTYVPLIGIFVILAWGIPELLGRPAQPAVLAPAACVLLVALVVLTRNQVQTWRDGWALWEHAAQVTEKNYVAHFNLGDSHMRRQEWDKAKAHFEQVVTFTPRYAAAHLNLGILLQREGHRDAATEHLLAAIRWQPDKNPTPYYHLGMMCHNQGRLVEAGKCYLEALRLAPQYAPAHRELGLTLTMLNYLPEAREHLAESVRLDPSDAEANSHLGMVFAVEGKPQQAILSFRRAVELDPDMAQARAGLALALREAGDAAAAQSEYAEILRRHPSWPSAANAAGRSLAIAPNPGWRNGRLAIQLAKQACQGFESPPPDFLDTFAAAYAEAGLFDTAVATAQQALRLATASGQESLAKQIEAKLRLYERQQPYHDEPVRASWQPAPER